MTRSWLASGQQERRRALGLALRQLRLERGISQAMLARKANVNRTYLSWIEAGRGNLAFDRLCRICDALRITPVRWLQAAAKHL